MQTVCQLDNDNTDILCHGKEHLTQVFCLNFYLICFIGNLTKFCYSVNQKSNLRSEFFLDLLIGHHRIFYDIMQQTGNNGFFIHLKLCQNDCYI